MFDGASRVSASSLGGPLVILLLGPPGCGKGTQSKLIAARLKIPAVSTGEMLRAEAEAGSVRGLAAQSILAGGALVGDDVVNEMAIERLRRPDCRRGFVLDGYPRTVPQAVFLGEFLDENGYPGPKVIHLKVSRDVLVSRVGARRHCPQCSRVYNLLYKTPRHDGICDEDGAELIRRNDDSAKVVVKRLRDYEALCGPLVAYYNGPNYHRVDGERQPEEIFEQVRSIVKSTKPVMARVRARLIASPAPRCR